MGVKHSFHALPRLCSHTAARQTSASTSVPDCLPQLEVRGILFDAGDILYDATAWWRWLAQLLVRLGTSTDYETLYLVWQHEYQPSVSCERQQWQAICRMLLARGLSSAQVQEILVAGRARYRALHEHPRPLPEVVPTLGRLRARGFPLAVASCTSRPADELCCLLDELEVRHNFADVFTTGQAGFAGPSPHFYRRVAEQFGFTAGDLALVAHDADELAAACQAGLTTLAYNAGSDTVADVVIHCFSQLNSVFCMPEAVRRAG